MQQNLEEVQYRKMIETPVKPLILKLAAPTIISMLITSIYNMADTYYVSQLGKSASGAVGVVFSLMAIIQAVGFTLGMGSGSIISRALGVRDNARADKFGSTAFFTALFMGIIITLSGTAFLSPIIKGLGATSTVLPFAKQYASYILFGAPIMAGSFVMNNILRAEGKAAFSMVGLTTGGFLNIGLDPLFIFTFKMGISGAAIATLISQAVSFSIMLSYFVFHKSVVNLSIKFVSKKLSDYADIIKTGAPSFCRQGFASISTILLNNLAGRYGDVAALSAMSIISKIYMMIFCVGLGIGQGYQPVAGYNYSAGKFRRMREAYIFTYIVCTGVMSVFAVAAYISAPAMIPLFIDDADVIAIGVRALRYQAAAMPFLSLNVACNMTFQSIGSKFKAMLLSCCRQGIMFIPSILLLTHFFGLTGVELTQTVSDILTFLFSIPFAIGFLLTLNRRIAAETNAA